MRVPHPSDKPFVCSCFTQKSVKPFAIQPFCAVETQLRAAIAEKTPGEFVPRTRSIGPLLKQSRTIADVGQWEGVSYRSLAMFKDN